VGQTVSSELVFELMYIFPIAISEVLLQI